MSSSTRSRAGKRVHHSMVSDCCLLPGCLLCVCAWLLGYADMAACIPCYNTVEKLRDFRLRHLFGTRYDFRKNLIDWDYQVRRGLPRPHTALSQHAHAPPGQSMVKPVAGNIHYTHYRAWRQTGVAFEFGDQTYTMPNLSMASYARVRSFVYRRVAACCCCLQRLTVTIACLCRVGSVA